MKKTDLFFLGFAIISLGILAGVIGQNLTAKSTDEKTSPTSPPTDTAAIKKQLTAAGVSLHEARYWNALPANNP